MLLSQLDIEAAARTVLQEAGGRRAKAKELLDSGAHVIASDDLYGGTFRLFERVRQRDGAIPAAPL